MYFGSIFQGIEEIDNDVTHHIGVRSMKWRFRSLFCVIRMCRRQDLKVKFYKVVAKASILYVCV